MQKNALSLYEFRQKIKLGLEGLFPFPVWVVAEISELSERKHCYLEFVERNEISDKIVAKTRAVVWAYTYNMLKPYFETTTGCQLAPGLKVLVNVEVQFSELYGFSLSVKDIDPNYTLGDIQQRRQEILNRLKEEGIFDMNKALDFPLLPKKIAIISSKKAAGYQDFMQQLQNNGKGYQFQVHMFSAIMQGEQSAPTIMQALERIYEYEGVFDAVVIIRGGGAVSDLSCFDDYELAAHIAQFPLPILTGIGHDKDKSIADEVAHHSFKTPTAVAAFLFDCFRDFETIIRQKSEYFSDLVKNRIKERQRLITTHSHSLCYTLPALLKANNEKLKSTAKDLNYLTLDKISIAKSKKQQLLKDLLFVLKQKQETRFETVNYLQRKLSHRAKQFLSNKNDVLVHKEQINELLSPQNMLARGYSITISQGKIVKDAKQLKAGVTIETKFAKGEIKAVVK